MGLMGYSMSRGDAENLAATFHSINHRLPELMRGLHSAHNAFISGAPMPGHTAIASISNLLNRVALTDNRDLIQQGAGTQAIHANQLTPFNKAPWQPAVLCDAKQIDGVLVCGMGGDRRGFLSWLKANNPRAEIIHMDLAPAPGVQADHFIQGDLQTLLPQLQTAVVDRIAYRQSSR
jgi:hypothetical protein